MLFNFLPYIQIVLSCLLGIAILLQQRGAGISGVFGGGDEGYHTRRGMEKILFVSTIVLAFLFLLSAFLALLK
ncbi:MAG: preprotein translocase subunit SecG [Candidatus Pacebacteria bacterium]|nr:preprotein translocase subunit SecG [Candidatus Paceibacterota bacterium]